MTDTVIIDELSKVFRSQAALSAALGLAQNSVSQWKQRGIPAAWRPTVWALIETHLPELASELGRDEFLKVRIMTDASSAD